MAIVNPYNYTRPSLVVGSGIDMTRQSKHRSNAMGPKQDAYLVQKVMTAKPQELTMMLYDGLVKFIKLAMTGLEKKEYEKVHQNSVKAQNIVEEFMSTLNHEFEISANLEKLYVFIHTELVEGNLQKSKEHFESALSIAVDLADTWREAMKNM